MKEKISRRDFLRDSLAVGAGALATAGLVACSPGSGGGSTGNPNETGVLERNFSFTPGKYFGRANGRNGDIVVAVTLTENAIVDISIETHQETAIISDPARSRIPADIVSYQSTAVDTVSGSTLSSLGVIQAVEDAIASSGARVSDVQVEYERRPLEKPPMVDARFAIIGGGIAGLSAAIRAAQLKIPVVLFEMTAHLGGDVLFCDGWSAGAGTMMQKAAGIDDSPELMYQELTVDRFNANSSTVWYEDQFRQICENNGPTVDWMDQYIGVHYDKRQVTRGTYGWDLTPRIYYTAGGFNIIDPMIQKIEEGISDGYITVMLEYEITKLVTDGSEKVIGIETTNPAGEAETFNFDAILMATGGFVNDNTMRRENMGKGVMGFGSTPKYANSLKLVEDVGGRFVNMKSTGGYGAGLDTGSPDICRYHIDYFYPYAFWVGKDGKRLLDEYKDFQGHMTFWRTVEDRIGWVIFPKDKRLDQRAIIKKGGFHNVDMSPWESWQFFDELLEQGQGIWEADTIEEIAQKMGVDAAGLTNTCEEINAAFSSGTADSFGRTKLCDMSGPFYAAKCYAWAISTSASCEVDIDFHVLDANNNPIPGLFVAGQLLGIQTPPTTKNQGGTGCSGAFPNQGRMAIERMIKEYTGEDTALASFTTNAVADDYNVEIWPMLLEKEDVLGYIDEP